MEALMTYTTRPSIKPGARSLRASALLLSLASLGLAAVSCSDDAEPDPAGSAGGGGASAGNGGGAGSGTAGSGGGAGSGGSAGTSGGSAGSDGMAGRAGSDGMAGSTSMPDASTAAFTLSSPAFDGQEGCGPGDDADACDLFPDETTDFAGDNVSPELSWSGAPAGTQSFAIALHDLSFTQGGDPFTHWVMWNIPASTTGLPEGLPDGQEPDAPAPEGSEQVSIGDDDGFFGSGAAGNVYEFVLYALSTPSIDPDTDDPDAVEQFIEELDAEVLGTATLRARSTPDDD
jgi:Raf kinase inhibitor-like YbhB/YbcL family protein